MAAVAKKKVSLAEAMKQVLSVMKSAGLKPKRISESGFVIDSPVKKSKKGQAK